MKLRNIISRRGLVLKLRSFWCIVFDHRAEKWASDGYGRCYRCLAVLPPAWFRDKEQSRMY